MHVIFDPRQLDHDPPSYFRRGALVAHPEQPQRATLLNEALLADGHVGLVPSDRGLSPILAVHDGDYVEFLLSAWDEWVKVVDDRTPAVPNYHPPRTPARVPKGIIGRLGHYCIDTGCPIVEGTARAIYWSAQSAVEGAERLLDGRNSHAYALCRPPGHHAYSGAANGFCFLNNAAIAAHHLRKGMGRVAILDIDTHGGNGTQQIFYERGDVLTVSLHVDPSHYPPYYLGYADETGAGAGEGTTLNLCLDPGAEVGTILSRLDEGLQAVGRFGAEALVVSLGFDMSVDDPLSLVKMTREGFAEAARRIAGLRLPTLLVQEGGYLGPSLATNAVAFLAAFDSARRALT